MPKVSKTNKQEDRIQQTEYRRKNDKTCVTDNPPPATCNKQRISDKRQVTSNKKKHCSSLVTRYSLLKKQPATSDVQPAVLGGTDKPATGGQACWSVNRHRVTAFRQNAQSGLGASMWIVSGLVGCMKVRDFASKQIVPSFSRSGAPYFTSPTIGHASAPS